MVRLDVKRRSTARVIVSGMIIGKKKKERGSFLTYVYKDADFPINLMLKLS